MGALLDRFAEAGVRLSLAESGQVCARGALTPELRDAIRSQRTAIVAELTAANDDAPDHGVPCRHWFLTFAGREMLEVIFSDDLSHAAVLAVYAEAVAAEPVPEAI